MGRGVIFFAFVCSLLDLCKQNVYSIWDPKPQFLQGYGIRGDNSTSKCNFKDHNVVTLYLSFIVKKAIAKGIVTKYIKA